MIPGDSDTTFAKNNSQTLQGPEEFLKTFSSEEEAALYRLRRNLNRTDKEKFEMLGRLMRIGKMLSSVQNTSKIHTMDVFDDDLLLFWSVLTKKSVRYIITDDFAVHVYGFERAADNLHLWLEEDKENRRQFRATFAELGYGDYPSIESMEFVPGWTQFYIARGLVLDVMTSMKGLEGFTFDECLQ